MVVTACGKDAPKKVDEGPPKTTPVPTDMVFNDFVPPSGGSGAVTGVKHDGGALETGMAGFEGTGAATAPAGDPGALPEAAAKLVVTDAGAEPRLPRKYAFVANRTDRRLITIRQSAGREGGGPAQEVAFALTADFTPKAVKPTSTRFELKIVKIDLPGVPAAQKAQATAQLAAFTGLTGTFDITSRGEVGEVEFKADEKMAAGGAEMILQSLQQALELVVPPFPDAPIGVGATWERKVQRNERGTENAAKHTFILKEASAEGGVVATTVDVSVPKHPFQQRGVPPGATEEVSGKGAYTYAFTLDHVSKRVEGEMAITRRIEVTDPKTGQKQAVAELAKLKNTFEVPGSAAR